MNTGIRMVEKLVKRIISFTTSDVFCSAMIAILNPPSLREQTSQVTFQGRPHYPQTGWWGGTVSSKVQHLGKQTAWCNFQLHEWSLSKPLKSPVRHSKKDSIFLTNPLSEVSYSGMTKNIGFTGKITHVTIRDHGWHDDHGLPRNDPTSRASQLPSWKHVLMEFQSPLPTYYCNE